MSIDANPSIKEIATTFEDTPPYSMSELYGLNFSSGNAVTSGTIRLSEFRNKTVEAAFGETKITASDGVGNYEFGHSVSISNDGSTAIVGIRYDLIPGSAYILEKANGVWTQTAKLTASDVSGGDDFGYSVAISGDGLTAIVGAYDDSNGSAYIFEKGGSGWSNMTATVKLTPSDMTGNLGFSVSISNDGSTALAGAWGDNSNSGAAYIFKKGGSGWSNMTETAKLTASVGTYYFGWSVAISGDGSTALVGSYGDGTYTGAAYIFEKGGSGWSNMTETAKLTASDGVSNDQFGTCVSISNDGSTALAGADRDDSSKGAAYIFEKGGSGWSNMTETGKLTASVRGDYNHFGISVSISNDGSTVLVGAYRYNSGRGGVYIFEKGGSGWSNMTETTILSASDGLGGDDFGFFVSISNDGSNIIVGAYSVDITTDGVTNASQGSAYIYEKTYFVN